MRPIYFLAMAVSSAIADIAEYILDPIVNAVWDAAGGLEYWAHKKLTKGED